MNNMIKMGMLIADKRGTYVIADIEDRYVKLLDVMYDSKGAIYYGCKARFIGIDDLDRFKTV